MSAPSARRDNNREQRFGYQLDDPYRWLEDPDNPDTLRWLHEQQVHGEAALGELPGREWFRETLRTLAGDTRSSSTPRRHGDWALRAVRNSEHPDGAVQASRDGADWHTVFDPRHRYPGRGAVLCRWDASPTGRLLATQVVLGGDESRTPLHLVEVASGAEIEHPVGDVRYTAVSWLDDDAFVYTRRAGVHLHRIGEPDVLLLGVQDPMARYQPRVWHRRWLTISLRMGTAAENALWWADLAAGGALEVIQPEPDAATSAVLRPDGRLLLVTTWGADRGQVVALPEPTADRNRWRPLVPEHATAMVRSITVTGAPPDDLLVLLRTRDGASEITVRDPDTGHRLATVPMPGMGTVTAMSAKPDATLCTVTYTDWVTPHSTWTLDPALPLLSPGAAADSTKAWREASTELVRYPSADGVEVPLTLLTPIDAEPDPRPTLLTAYGGFGVPFAPSFQPDMLAWIRAGGTVAIADVRGGGGHGEQWHRSGSRDQKQNTFDDLHSAAEWLTSTGRTTPEKLALLGGSNGGLLVTGAMLQRPHRYGAAVAIAPLTDMVRYELSGLGAAWTQEYGSASDPEELGWLLGYSPYHNVAPGRRYPALLLITGDNDTRVDPLHSRKLCAALQHADPAGGPTLIRVVPGAGHARSPAEKAAEIAVAAFSFLAHHCGLPIPETPRPASRGGVRK